MPETAQSDRDRVFMMLEEGKITADEAKQLLEALGVSEKIESDMQELEAELKESTEQSKQDSLAEENEQEAAPLEEQSRETEEQDVSTELSNDLNWLSIKMLAGDLDIRVDPNITEPIVDKGKVTFRKEGNVYSIGRRNIKRGKSLTGNLEDMANNLEDVAKDIGNFVSDIFQGLTGDLKVRIPPQFAVDINSKAGDVDVDGAVYLKAAMLAGDLDARNIGGVHINMAAGDVDIRMKPTSGENYIKLAAGDLDIEIEKGSSVRIGASVVLGEVDLKGPQELQESVNHNKRIAGGDFTVKVGEGEASLEIDLHAGDLDVVVAR